MVGHALTTLGLTCVSVTLALVGQIAKLVGVAVTVEMYRELNG